MQPLGDDVPSEHANKQHGPDNEPIHRVHQQPDIDQIIEFHDTKFACAADDAPPPEPLTAFLTHDRMIPPTAAMIRIDTPLAMLIPMIFSEPIAFPFCSEKVSISDLSAGTLPERLGVRQEGA
jgi:hypothetical protein